MTFYHYSECHYAVCRYAECCDAILAEGSDKTITYYNKGLFTARKVLW